MIINWLWKGETYIDNGHYFGFIYLIKDNINNKMYIGEKSLTTTPHWTKYKSSNKRLKSLITKDTINDFEFHILALVTDKSIMKYLEAKFILQFGCLESDNFYNANVNIHTMCKVKDYSNRVNINHQCISDNLIYT